MRPISWLAEHRTKKKAPEPAPEVGVLQTLYDALAAGGHGRDAREVLEFVEMVNEGKEEWLELHILAGPAQGQLVTFTRRPTPEEQERIDAYHRDNPPPF